MKNKVVIGISIMFLIIVIFILILFCINSKFNVNISNNIIKIETLYEPKYEIPIAVEDESRKRLAIINIKVNNQIIEAEIYDNPTSKSFLELLPLTVPIWHPAEIAKAFNLPHTIDNSISTTREYKSGELAYWNEGPSIAIFYNHNFEQTVVPVITIGRILNNNENIFENFSGSITISLKDN